MKTKKSNRAIARPRISKRLVTEPDGKMIWDIAIPYKNLTEVQRETIERNSKLSDWEARIEKGDLDALQMLHRWAKQSTLALNGIKNLEVMKRFDREFGFGPWPLLVSRTGKPAMADLEKLRTLDLASATLIFDLYNRKHQDTIERTIVLGLIDAIYQIFNKLEYLSPEEVSFSLQFGDRRTQVPVDLMAACKRLPFRWVAPKRVILERYWSLVKRLFILCTDDKYHEFPPLKQKVERISTRKEDKPNSAGAISLMRSDILKRLKEALSSLMGPGPKR